MTTQIVTDKIALRDMERAIVLCVERGYYTTAQYRLEKLIDYSRKV